MSEGSGTGGGGNLPARRLGNQELEAVIRRAVELQAAREHAAGDPDGVSEAEVVRIGKELGLDAASVRQAIAEVRTAPPVAERGLVAGLMGDGVVRASRVIRRPAAPLGMFLEQYLGQVELMVVERRFPDRTRYGKAQGMAASMARAFSKLNQKQASLGLDRIDVGVAMLDEDSAVVEVSVDLRGERAGYLGGGAAVGTSMGSLPVVFALVSGAPDLLALAGLPVFAAAFLGLRAGYRTSFRGVQEKLEGFLDRLEHGELRLPPPAGPRPDWRRQLGI